jgi:hypothetical protein
MDVRKKKKEPPRDKLAIFYAGRTYSNGNSEFLLKGFKEGLLFEKNRFYRR